MATTQSNYEQILDAIRAWHPAKRIELVQEVLESLKAQTDVQRSGESTLTRALGLLATDGEPPSDEEVEQWLDEHRLENTADEGAS